MTRTADGVKKGKLPERREMPTFESIEPPFDGFQGIQRDFVGSHACIYSAEYLMSRASSCVVIIFAFLKCVLHMVAHCHHVAERFL